MNEGVLEEKDYSGEYNWTLWGKILRRAMVYKGHLAALAFLGVLVAGCDASFPLLTKFVIDELTERGAQARLWPWIVAYTVLTATITLSIWLFILLGGKISTHLSHDMRSEGFARLQELSFAYFDRRPVGWMIARLTSDCDRLAEFVAWGLLDTVWCVALMASLASCMFWLDPGLALAALAVVPFMLWICFRFKGLLLESARKVRKQNSLLTAAFNEGLSGARTIKTLVREEAQVVEFREVSGQMQTASVRNALQSALFWPLMISLGSLGTGIALWRGGAEAMAGTIGLGTLVAFLNYTGRFFDPIGQLAQVLSNSQRAQASAERIIELLETQPEIRDTPALAAQIKARQAHTPDDGLAEDGLGVDIGEVEFRNVCFRYAQGHEVIHDFNLRLKTGTTVALVGPTGGGKTTIANLMCRFYEPSDGEILLDGVEYRRRGLHWFQSNLGIVLQTPHLFQGTIQENIRFGRLEASDEEVVEAARRVHAHPFISAMEKGYLSEVGQGGHKLSAGQRQLISLARAILARPRILVMDEATSAVDAGTEKEIQAALAEIFRGRMNMVIAHRLSTIRDANLILVIQQGRVVESGTHLQLMGRRSAYFQLYIRQFAHAREDDLIAGRVVEA